MTPPDTQNSWKWVKNTLFYPPEPFKIDLEKITSKKISAILTIFRPSTLKSPVARARCDQTERNPD